MRKRMKMVVHKVVLEPSSGTNRSQLAMAAVFVADKLEITLADIAIMHNDQRYAVELTTTAVPPK